MRTDYNKYFFLDVPSGVWSCPPSIHGGAPDDPIDLRKADASVVLGMYEDMAEKYPSYVSRRYVTTVSDYNICRYTFAMPGVELRPTGNDLPVNRRFKIVMTAGIHGYEEGCSWILAHFFRLLCEEPDDRLLGFLRRNVVFEVLPCANPWGFTHDSRTNENGVDINRNFNAERSEQWQPGQQNYMGAYPHSEPETRALVGLLEENTDAEYVIDCHNISTDLPLFYVHDDEQTRLMNSVMSELTYKWQKEYPELNAHTQTLLGSVRPSGRYGMFTTYAYNMGFNTFTLETPWCMRTIGKERYDTPTTRISMEVLVNTVLAVVRSYR